MSSSCGRFPGGPLASGLSKPLLIMTPPPSALPFPELQLPKPFTMSYPSSHLVLREVGAQVALSSPFHRWGRAGSERGSADPGVAQLVGVGGRSSCSPRGKPEPPSRQGRLPAQAARSFFFASSL